MTMNELAIFLLGVCTGVLSLAILLRWNAKRKGLLEEYKHIERFNKERI